MRKQFTIIFCILINLFFAACQKEITVNLPDYHNKIIVEGYIENGQPAVVIISKSMPYFSNINLDTLLNKIMIANAVVTVTSNTGESEQLSFGIYPNDSPMFFAYKSSTLRGEEGKTYTLNIELEGKTYTATTSILRTFDLDSIWLAFDMFTRDSTASVRLLMTDDPSTTDYYRYQVKVYGRKPQNNAEPIHDIFWASTPPAVFDDLNFSGQQFNFEVLRAFPAATIFMADMSEEDRKEYGRMTFKYGDTIFVKHSKIDYDSYRFFNSSSGLGAGNPFLSPAPIISNIKGENVIGVWCGSAAKIDTIYFNHLQNKQLGTSKI